MKCAKKYTRTLLILITVLSLCTNMVFAAENPFIDVPSDSWYATSVNYCYANGLMNGVSDNKFAPNENMTRAMLITVLYRNEGCPSVLSATPFVDVGLNTWYTDAIAWGYQNKIIHGTSNTTFEPNVSLTREQMVTIFYRYANYIGLDTTNRNELSNYIDSNLISDYAIEGFEWAIANDVIYGISDNQLSPMGHANRAQLATVLYRIAPFLDKTASSDKTNKNVVQLTSYKNQTVDSILTHPVKSDFGKYYDNAVTVYNAIIEKKDTVIIYFPDEGTNKDYTEVTNEEYAEVQESWSYFYNTFNQKVLNNFSNLEYSSVSYHLGKAVIAPKSTYDMVQKELNTINLYYDTNVAAGLHNGMSEYDAVANINKWICNNITYSDSASTPPTYVLKTKEATCTGYSNLFCILCDNAGIDCRIVNGYCYTSINSTSPLSHTWNRVKVDNIWYYIDVCWNDTDCEWYSYYLSEYLWSNHFVNYEYGVSEII